MTNQQTSAQLSRDHESIQAQLEQMKYTIDRIVENIEAAKENLKQIVDPNRA